MYYVSKLSHLEITDHLSEQEESFVKNPHTVPEMVRLTVRVEGMLVRDEQLYSFDCIGSMRS